MRRLGATVVAIAALLAWGVAPQAAAAHTCGSNWCSGSDGSTQTNIQGNAPQVYIGEVGTYEHSFYGVDGPCPNSIYAGMCWSTAGADGAAQRYNANTGIGVEGYYFGGGPGVNNQGVSAICFGALQGYYAAYNMVTRFNQWTSEQFMLAIDIESPVSDYGWEPAETSADRAVFNGFYDFVSDDNQCSSVDGGTNNVELSQPVIYSAPDAWESAMGSNGYIGNTPEWSYEKCCESSWPGADWGGLFQGFGDTRYRWALQYDQNPDYDDAYEPQYMPVWGFSLGS